MLYKNIKLLYIKIDFIWLKYRYNYLNFISFILIAYINIKNYYVIYLYIATYLNSFVI